MRFWDSSALIPLLIEEKTTPQVRGILKSDPDFSVWWGSRIECVSAISRLERMKALNSRDTTEALRGSATLLDTAVEIAPSPALRDLTCRLLRVHPLTSADAVQLAAALIACEQKPSTLELVSLDERLRDAAGREGFRVLPD